MDTCWKCVFLHYCDMKCALDMHVYSLVFVLYLFMCVFMCVGVLVCLCIHKVCTGYRSVQYLCGPLCVFSRCVHVCLCKCYILFVCVCRVHVCGCISTNIPPI